MGQLIVRNLDDRIVAALKHRAAAHGRSAEAEHRAILTDTLADEIRADAQEDWFERARALRMRLRVGDGRTSTDLLRADRDRDVEPEAGAAP